MRCRRGAEATPALHGLAKSEGFPRSGAQRPIWPLRPRGSRRERRLGSVFGGEVTARLLHDLGLLCGEAMWRAVRKVLKRVLFVSRCAFLVCGGVGTDT